MSKLLPAIRFHIFHGCRVGRVQLQCVSQIQCKSHYCRWRWRISIQKQIKSIADPHRHKTPNVKWTDKSSFTSKMCFSIKLSLKLYTRLEYMLTCVNTHSTTQTNLPVDQGWSSGTGSTGSAGPESADDILGGAVGGMGGGDLLPNSYTIRGGFESHFPFHLVLDMDHRLFLHSTPIITMETIVHSIHTNNF